MVDRHAIATFRAAIAPMALVLAACGGMTPVTLASGFASARQLAIDATSAYFTTSTSVMRVTK
jgi:hypothetical protein